MATKLTSLTNKIAIQVHLVGENCTIYSSPSRRPVRKLLDNPSYENGSVAFFSTVGTKFLNKIFSWEKVSQRKI
jgi:hypothetical protein